MWQNIDNLPTFKDFSRLMGRRHYSLDDMVDMFHGKLDENRALFTRVFESREHADVVIPYRSVLNFYYQEKRSEELKKLAVG